MAAVVGRTWEGAQRNLSTCAGAGKPDIYLYFFSRHRSDDGLETKTFKRGLVLGGGEGCKSHGGGGSRESFRLVKKRLWFGDQATQHDIGFLLLLRCIQTVTEGLAL